MAKNQKHWMTTIATLKRRKKSLKLLKTHFSKGELISNELVSIIEFKFAHYFLFFNQLIAHQRQWKIILFQLKSPFCSQHIQNLVIFFPFHTFQIQKDKWRWNKLCCHEMACTGLDKLHAWCWLGMLWCMKPLRCTQFFGRAHFAL